MATGAASSNDSRTHSDNVVQETGQHEIYIQRQISRTRYYVKLRDLAISFVQCSTLTVALFLALAVWDHWVSPLATWGRVVSLLLLLAIWIYAGVTQFAPLLLRQINPVYAARTIEQAVPGLRNSLTNFFLLRSQSLQVPPIVYDAVGQQAAKDLGQVNVKTTVDNSRLLRMGYVFATIVALSGLYSFLSPKSPLKTIRRVVTPWANISRPSRVEISEVAVDDVVSKVGESVPVLLGQMVDVSAVARGVKHDEVVVLYYSTADEQIVNQPLEMHAVTADSTYEVILPADAKGLQQDIVFHIEAGDAVTGDYVLGVSRVPCIRVSSVTYDYPAYTQLEPKVIRDRGDIRSVEGTRITMTVKANQEIESASIQFKEIDETNQTQAKVPKTPNYVQLLPNGKLATANFSLSLPAGHRSLLRRSYEVHFTNHRGKQDNQPVQHLLEIIPDLAPEIEILAPMQQEIELPVDREQVIELLARDPDFGLIQIQLQMVAGGETILTKTLLDDPGGWRGNANRRFHFVPRKYGLRPGHQVTYWATARDNYGDAVADGSASNMVFTSKYRFVIVESKRPDAAADFPQESPGKTGDDGLQERANGQESTESVAEERSASDSSTVSNEKSGSEVAGSQREQESAAADDTSEQDSANGSQPESTGQQNSSAVEGETSDTADQSGTGMGSTDDGPSDSDSSAESESSGPGASRRATDGSDDGDIFEEILEHMRKSQDTGESSKPTGKLPADSEAETGSQNGTRQLEKTKGEDDTTPVNESNPTLSHGDRGQNLSAGEEPIKGDPREGDAADAVTGGGQSPEDVTGGDKDLSGNTQSGDDQQRLESEVGETKDDQGTAGAQQAHRRTASQLPSHDGKTEAPSEEQKLSGAGQPQASSTGEGAGDLGERDKPDHEQGGSQADKDRSKTSKVADDVADDTPSANGRETSSQGGNVAQAAGKNGKTGESQSTSEVPDQSPSSDTSSDRSTSLEQNARQSESDIPPVGDARLPGSPSTGPLSTTGGGPGQQQTHSPVAPVQDADAPNSEYSEEATDMALRYLKDQQDNPDRALLDELGWSDGELRRFLERWEQLKRKSQQDAASHTELQERLESLGLQPPLRRTRVDPTGQDSRGGLSDAANRTRPPAEYLDQVKAYQQSIAEERE